MVVVDVVGVVEVVLDVVVDDAPWSCTQCSSTLDAPRSVVFADAATTSGLDCIWNAPLDDLPHVLVKQIKKL